MQPKEFSLFKAELVHWFSLRSRTVQGTGLARVRTALSSTLLRMFRTDPERRVHEVGDRVKDARMAAARMSASCIL